MIDQIRCYWLTGRGHNTIMGLCAGVRVIVLFLPSLEVTKSIEALNRGRESVVILSLSGIGQS